MQNSVTPYDKIEEFAPAKINLALHVINQQEDGYHLLDMLVGFVDIGDRLTIACNAEQNAPPVQLEIDGSYGRHLANDGSNLIIKAAYAFIEHYLDRENLPCNYHIKLTKNLPISSGIGGGSSNAAALLRAFAKIHDIEDQAGLLKLAKSLGADCPMCLFMPVQDKAKGCYASGIGEVLTPIQLPNMPIVLVNPNNAVSTPESFSKLRNKQNSPLPPLPNKLDETALISTLKHCRNDLTKPAIEILPEIETVLHVLKNFKGVQFSAMSGSGATCFAVFEDDKDSKSCAKKIQSDHPNWWVSEGHLL